MTLPREFTPGFTRGEKCKVFKRVKCESELVVVTYEPVAELQAFVVVVTLSWRYFDNDSVCGSLRTDQKVCLDM